MYEAHKDKSVPPLRAARLLDLLRCPSLRRRRRSAPRRPPSQLGCRARLPSPLAPAVLLKSTRPMHPTRPTRPPTFL